ncbi:MAG: hypothetical protein HY074_14975 [Deltaproteobacteria bacterium]|nr:hypothetical protein [Deltaproteobacteria bacterium]
MVFPIFSLLIASSAPAATSCFDFETKIVKPLHAPIPLVAGADKTESGETTGGLNWGALRAAVNKPVSVLYRLLLDHHTTASSRIDEMKVEKITSPSYLNLERVSFLIKPFLFVKVRWTEEWGFALVQGTAADPEELVVSYQKTEGTSHIEHLCGNMVLRKLTDKSTDVFLYEEAKATGRKPKDTMDGLMGTLKTLRK